MDQLHRAEAGVTMVEYAVVLALIALLAIGLVALLGFSVRDFFGSKALRDALA